MAFKSRSHNNKCVYQEAEEFETSCYFQVIWLGYQLLEPNTKFDFEFPSCQREKRTKKKGRIQIPEGKQLCFLPSFFPKGNVFRGSLLLYLLTVFFFSNILR